ncbi:MAG: SHOCT domain-containing protein [Alphaproteobacteria bacterium]|nr:SHOCT domain-containing protein [Alphaproteobacteria bacterium]
MQTTMPTVPEALSYSVVAAAAITIVAALLTAVIGTSTLVAAVLVLAIAGGIYWLIGRHPATIVTAKQAAGIGAALLAICALADLAAGFPYQGVLFLLAAGALAVGFVLLQQGTIPIELRFGTMSAFTGSAAIVQLRMLEELRDAGILTPEEFAAKRAAIVP